MVNGYKIRVVWGFEGKCTFQDPACQLLGEHIWTNNIANKSESDDTYDIFLS